jgi:S-layer homology domain.
MKHTRSSRRQRHSAAMLAAWLLIWLSSAGAAAAFPDISGDPNADRIRKLQEEGVLTGDANGRFRPDDRLTYAEGVSMIVKGLRLSLEGIRFVKAPKASDSYDFVLDGKWYSDAFITASFYLDLPRSVKPDLSMTRERFAYHLFSGLKSKAGFELPAPKVTIEDAADIAPEYRDSIQLLLFAGIAELDQDKRFQPKRAITRSEAAGMLYEASAFLRQLEASGKPVKTADPSPLTDLKLESEPLTENVNAVTVRATAPHPGYGIRVASIVFDDGKAFLHVEPVMPNPDRMYPQVLTEVSTVVYIGADYTPVLALPE